MILLCACAGSRDALPPAANAAASKSPTGDAGIAWFKGDVNAAFVAAKADNRPVFLYWGAVWCPPCNQVKATIFNRQDFIERSRFFVPVYIDGDSPSAQTAGRALQGERLSDHDPAQARRQRDHAAARRSRSRAVHAGADAGHERRAAGQGNAGGARSATQRCEAHAPRTGGCSRTTRGKPTSSNCSPRKNVASTLQRLALACPADQPETAARLELQALVAASKAKDAKPRDDKAATAQALWRSSPTRSSPAKISTCWSITRAKIANLVTLPKSPERARVVAAWNCCARAAYRRRRLSTADRLSAVDAEVALAKLDAPKATLPDALLKTVRERSRARRSRNDRTPMRGRP